MKLNYILRTVMLRMNNKYLVRENISIAAISQIYDDLNRFIFYLSILCILKFNIVIMQIVYKLNLNSE